MSEIRTRLQGGTPFFPNMLNNGNVEVCLKEDVDNVLAEKDAEIATLKNEVLRQKRLRCYNLKNLGKVQGGDKMKCDELRIENACVYGPDAKVYLAEQVDEAIEELQAENAELKQKLENVQASMYADVVDANMENRRLKRALWLARAEWARSSALSYHLIESHPDKDVSATYKRKANKWEKAKDKCLKKAEEYK